MVSVETLARRYSWSISGDLADIGSDYQDCQVAETSARKKSVASPEWLVRLLEGKGNIMPGCKSWLNMTSTADNGMAQPRFSTINGILYTQRPDNLLLP